MIDIKKLKQLIGLMVDNDLTEMDLEGDGEKVHLFRGPRGPVQVAPPAPATPAPPPAPAPTAPALGGDAEPAAPSGPTIDSPMVGTFYLAASPDAAPFVGVGDSVDDDSVVCIIEAMKVFNEIKAEKAGTIAEVLVSNGDAVDFGQPLFRLK